MAWMTARFGMAIRKCKEFPRASRLPMKHRALPNDLQGMDVPSRSTGFRRGDPPTIGPVVVDSMEGTFALQPGPVEQISVKAFFDLGQHLAPSAHDDPRGLEEPFQGQAGRDFSEEDGRE